MNLLFKTVPKLKEIKSPNKWCNALFIIYWHLYLFHAKSQCLSHAHL